MPDTQLFRDVSLCQLYAFDCGIFNRDRFKAVQQEVNSDRMLWIARATGRSIDGGKIVTEDRNLLSMLSTFDDRYLYPEFRDLERAIRFLLPNFSVVHKSLVPAEIVFTLHKNGVGTFLILLDAFDSMNASELKALASLQSKPLKIHYTEHLRRVFQSRATDASEELSLDQICLRLLQAIAPASDILGLNHVSLDQGEGSILGRSTVNSYQFISINGVPEEVTDITTYIDNHRQALVDTAEAYSAYLLDKSITDSRKGAVIRRHFPPESSERRHLVYQINSMRLFCVSAIDSHPEIYKYHGRRWYYSYLGILELGFSQFEAIYLLHGELCKGLRRKDALLTLQERSFEVMVDFLNARIIDHPRARTFMKHVAEALRVEEYYGVVRDRLELANGIATDRASSALKQREHLFQILGLALSLILGLQFADLFYTRLVVGVLEALGMRLLIPEFSVVLVLWVGLVVIFGGLFVRRAFGKEEGKE